MAETPRGLAIVEVLGRISGIERIAVGRSIRELREVRAQYGPGRWRKLKGVATVRLEDGTISVAEVHWDEAHGVGRRDLKVKRRFRE